jgi:hypothetical protein
MGVLGGTVLNKSTIATGFIVLAGLQSAVRAETYSFTDGVQTFSSVTPPPNATFERTE